MGNRLAEGVCILCGFPLLDDTNQHKDIQGMCEKCTVKFKEKVEAMRKNPDLRTKGWKFVRNTRDLPPKLREKALKRKEETKQWDDE